MFNLTLDFNVRYSCADTTNSIKVTKNVIFFKFSKEKVVVCCERDNL